MEELPTWKDILKQLATEGLIRDSKIVECDINIMYHRSDEPFSRGVVLRFPDGKLRSDITREVGEAMRLQWMRP